jgi:hypothetical protein
MFMGFEWVGIWINYSAMDIEALCFVSSLFPVSLVMPIKNAALIEDKVIFVVFGFMS